MVRQITEHPELILFSRNEEIQTIRQLPTKDISEYLMKARYSQRVRPSNEVYSYLFLLDYSRIC
jgi:hypothetical protein